MVSNDMRNTIKICGLTTPDAVDACVEGGIGFTGFIACERSVRHLTPPRMAALMERVPASIRRVMVSVDMPDDTLASYIDACRPDMLQLHGAETPERCAQLSERYGLPIIKALGIASTEDAARLAAYAPSAAMLLADSKRADGSSGGTGQAFDWSALEGFAPPCPWFLSGGIGAENLTAAIDATNAPLLDVSSALESSPGIKDPSRIRAFLTLADALSV